MEVDTTAADGWRSGQIGTKLAELPVMNCTFKRHFTWSITRLVSGISVMAALVALPLLAGAQPVGSPAVPVPITLASATTAPIPDSKGLPVEQSTPAEKTATATQTAPAAANDLQTLLKQAAPNNPALWQSVISMINQQGGTVTSTANPALVIISYRTEAGGVRDVVVQLYSGTAADIPGVLNPQGTVRGRLGDELYDSADSFLGLMYRQVTYLGEKADVQRQQRAINSTIDGDMTLLREATVNPLHVVAIMPSAKQFLPGSLKTRVNSVVLNAELSFGEWKGKVGLITDNAESAQTVGTIVSAWKEMAVSLAQTFAAQKSGQPLQEALKSTTIDVADNQVIASASIPSETIVRATKEITGHGAPKAVLMCYRGFSVEVPESQVRTYMERGASLGACRGDQGRGGNQGIGGR